nr:carbamoyltransferase C-terminal domain-containing protein [Enterovibrio nigricans]
MAAHGDPTKLLHKMKCLIDTNAEGRIRAKVESGYLPSYHNNYELLNSLFDGDSKEDIAAAAQQHLENILLDVLSRHINPKEPVNLCLAGGVFGNVKLNQRLREMPSVKNIFVLPAMGDDGLPLGAAVVASYNLTGQRSQTTTMKLGPCIETRDILTSLESNPQYKVLKGNQADIVRLILSSLKKNKILGLVRGRMEFGPRALCNRSIICSAKDQSINRWLNERMNRTEFMPFAPIIADIHATDSFVGWKDNHIASQFMTITYNCTDYFTQACPAVTHIDKTARPQVITRVSDSFMHQILIGWEKLSGEPALINTSFNMHEEPIILNVDNGLKNLDREVVDILVINEDVLIWRTDSHHDMEFLHE